MDIALAASSGLLIGAFVGSRWYRWRLHRAIRESAKRHPATPQSEAIDQDAMLRIIRQHQGDR